MKKNLYLPMFILLISGGIILTNCKSNNAPNAPNAPNDTTTLIKLTSSTTLGNYLTDKNGYALYFFADDLNGFNTCTGGCTANWVNFFADSLSQANLGNGLVFSDFNAIPTTTGKQLTYKGWPLYKHAPGGVQDPAGNTSGDGIGGIWFVAKPTYTIMIANYQLVGYDGNNYVASTTAVTSAGTGVSKFFTDLQGRTLYSYMKDSALINKFTNSDFSNNSEWPIYINSKLDLPYGIDKTLFDSITVHGYKQLTYKGWPMFYFGSDFSYLGSRGHTKGIGLGVLNKWGIFTIGIPPAP